MASKTSESEVCLANDLKDGDEELGWEAEPPLEPPPDDGTEEDYPLPGG